MSPRNKIFLFLISAIFLFPADLFSGSIASSFTRRNAGAVRSRWASFISYRALVDSLPSGCQSESVDANLKVTCDASVDTSVAYDSEDASIENTSFGNDATIGSGCRWVTVVDQSSSDFAPVVSIYCAGALIKSQPLKTFLDNANMIREGTYRIISATLKLQPTAVAVGDGSVLNIPAERNPDYVVYGLKETWTENTTWRQGVDEQASPTGTLQHRSSTTSLHSYDISSIVNRWLDRTWTNYGLAVWPTTIMDDFLETSLAYMSGSSSEIPDETELLTFFHSTESVDTNKRPKFEMIIGR